MKEKIQNFIIGVMTIIVFMAVISTINKANADTLVRPYITMGVGIHSENMDCPEVCFGHNILGMVGVGVTTSISEDNQLFIEWELSHISATNVQERGYGLNAAWAKLRYYFK